MEVHHEYISKMVGKKYADKAEVAKIKDEQNKVVFQFSIKLSSLKELAKIYFKLKIRGMRVTTLDHGSQKVLYFDDPAHNIIELFVATKNKPQKPMIITPTDLQKWSRR